MFPQKMQGKECHESMLKYSGRIKCSFLFKSSVSPIGFLRKLSTKIKFTINL